jgi:cation diffusion facilitator family transporter
LRRHGEYALCSNRMEQTPADYERAGRKLALWSVLAGLGLAILKVAVGLAAHSTAVVSDGCEAAADVVSSGIVYAGLWLASRPPDENHPYGHGRYETLASLAVGSILVFTGLVIGWRSFVSMSQVHPLRMFALYPLFLAIAVKVVLAMQKRRSARLISSAALAADAWHDVTDLISTFIALIAVGMSLWNPARFREADHVGGMLIGVIIVCVGFRLIRATVEQLTDAMPDIRLMRQIRTVALAVPGAWGIEKCFARRTGFRYHVDLHLEVDPELTVRESHEIAMQVKISIKENLGWVADVLVHVEPAPAGRRPLPERQRKSSGSRR